MQKIGETKNEGVLILPLLIFCIILQQFFCKYYKEGKIIIIIIALM